MITFGVICLWSPARTTHVLLVASVSGMMASVSKAWPASSMMMWVKYPRSVSLLDRWAAVLNVARTSLGGCIQEAPQVAALEALAHSV